MMWGRRRVGGRWLAVGASVVAAACGGSSEKHGVACDEPGLTEACSCPGQPNEGTRTCRLDGYWSECDCDTPYDEGGAGRGGSDSASSGGGRSGSAGTAVGGDAGDLSGAGGSDPAGNAGEPAMAGTAGAPAAGAAGVVVSGGVAGVSGGGVGGVPTSGGGGVAGSVTAGTAGTGAGGDAGFGGETNGGEVGAGGTGAGGEPATGGTGAGGDPGSGGSDTGGGGTGGSGTGGAGTGGSSAGGTSGAGGLGAAAGVSGFSGAGGAAGVAGATGAAGQGGVAGTGGTGGCSIGQTVCVGNVLKECTDGETWSETTCEGVTPVCGPTQCLLCAPGSAVCAGATLRTCESGGMAYANSDCGSAGQCDAVNARCVSGSVAEVCVGWFYSCARKVDGAVECWGSISTGIPSPRDTYVPAQVPALPAVEHLDCGVRMACGIASGTLYCWGMDARGSLGPSPTSDGSPTAIPGLGTVSEVAVTSHGACVVVDGEVWCWGNNEGGLLGQGTSDTDAHPNPVQVQGISGAVELETEHAYVYGNDDDLHAIYCARTASAIYCWGSGARSPVAVPLPAGTIVDIDVRRETVYMRLDVGQVWSTTLQADNTFPSPALVSSPPSVAMDRSCYVSSNGTVSCNTYLPMGSAIAVSYGGDSSSGHSCVLSDSGVVRCWGYNSNGQVGGGDSTRPFVPAPAHISGLTGVASMYANEDSTAVLLADGSVFAWGYHYELLDGFQVGSYGKMAATPAHVDWAGDGYDDMVMDDRIVYLHSPADGWTSARNRTLDPAGGVLAGGDSGLQVVNVVDPFTFARKADGTVVVSATGTYGSGNVVFGNDMAPYTLGDVVEVTGSTGSVGVALGGGHACMWFGDGTVECWGNNGDGQLGDGLAGTSAALPVSPVFGVQPFVVDACARGSQTCARTDTGHVYCWGRGSATGQASVAFPVQLPAAVTGVEHILCGAMFGCASSADTTWCWGSGVTYDDTVWEMTGLPPVRKLVGGGSTSSDDGFACALTTSDEVYCWGNNDLGQVGVDSDQDSFDLPQKLNLSGVSDLVAGDYHACALLQSGDLYCWGSRENLQVGNGEANYISDYNALVVEGLD